MKIIKFQSIAVAMILSPLSAMAEKLEVSGMPWPPLETDAPSNITGQHPIFGTVVCPPLFESSQLESGFSPVLLESLPEVRVESGKTAWVMRIKAGARWWSGDAWQASQLVDFLKTRLADIVHQQSAGNWSMPGFHAEATSDQPAIKLVWANSPKFGPGILANWPIFRPTKSTRPNSIRYECLGKFKLESAKPEKVELRSNQVSLTVTQIPSKPEKPPSDRFIQFRMAANFGGSPWVRMSDEPIECKQKIELPNFLILSWNSKLWPTSIPEIRKVLTQLSPRGELLRSGAGSLGDLVSAPILRNHPGYNKSVLVRSFSLADSVKELERLGFKRPSPVRPREASDGREIKLKIQVDEGLSGLIEKVIFDSFHSVGIKIERAKSSDATSEIHGRLSGVFVVSRHFDWFPILKLQGESAAFLSLPDDSQLDEFAEKYSLSLTEMKPRYDLLRGVHQRFHDLEPFAVLMHNRACIESNFKINASALESSNLNPHWLVKILGID
jgi:hypothetical protein